jgi:hypothetical protein
MHLLRSHVHDIKGLASFVADVAEYPLVQGVVLDINPVWFLAYQCGRAGISPDWFGIGQELVLLETIDGDTVDLGWRDNTRWLRGAMERVQGQNNRAIPESALPFVVKIIAKPVGLDLLEKRSQLVEFVRKWDFFAVVETRSLGRLAVSPGGECVTGASSGTIGGFLTDQNTGVVYATTCGHVVSAGASVLHSGSHLGVCTHSRAPRQLAPGQSCTPGCPAANSLDLALIDIGTLPVANLVTGVATSIASHQSIVLRGGVSKVNSFQVGGLVLTYCPGNSNVCFENMFEVRPPSGGGIFNAQVRAAIATLPTQGDSGGWLETTGGDWCGVLVAADHLMGYALEADDVIAKADAAFGTRLRL